MAEGTETAEGIRKKVESISELCRKNKITLNPAEFRISKNIKVGGLKISSDDTDPNPKIKPTKLAINKVLDFPEPECKKAIQRFVGLMNTLHHWCNKLIASCPNIKALAGNRMPSPRKSLEK